MKEPRNARRRREQEQRKAERKKEQAAEIAARQLRVIDGAKGRKATVRDTGEAKNGQQVIDAVNVEYSLMVGVQCPGCGKMKGYDSDEAVASAFNRATFIMQCVDCGTGLRMRPKKKKKGANRAMQGRALKIADAKEHQASGLYGPDGRPL